MTYIKTFEEYSIDDLFKNIQIKDIYEIDSLPIKIKLNPNKIKIYHGSEHNDIDELKTDMNKDGLYCSTDIDVAQDYAGKDGIIYELTNNNTIKILNLSYPEHFLKYLIKYKIYTRKEINSDYTLMDLIMSGDLFQHDYKAMDMFTIRLKNIYDLLIVPDNLNNKGNNLAFIITKLENFQYIKVKC